MRNSAGPDDAPDTAPDQHVRPRRVAPLRTANDRTARLGLERPPTTAEFHTRPLAADYANAEPARREAAQLALQVLAHGYAFPQLRTNAMHSIGRSPAQ